MSDKYGADQAPDCYPGTNVLINLLGLRNADDLDEAERYLNEVAAMKLEFVFNAGYLVDWHSVDREGWIEACIQSFYGADQPLADIFDQCIGASLTENEF